MKISKKAIFNGILVILVILLVVLPLVFLKKADFSGADSQVESVIMAIDPSYKPWVAPLFKPASGEIESLFFALQAAIGAGVIGFGLGYYKGVSSTERKSKC